MKICKTILITAALILGTALSASQQTVEAIVAVVNDDIITLTEYKEQHDFYSNMLRSQYQGENLTSALEKMNEELLNTMITDMLLLQEAKRMSIDVSEQLSMTIESTKEQNGLETDEQLIMAMRRQGIIFEDWKMEQEEMLMRQAVIFTEVERSITINDTEIVNYYSQHPDEFILAPERKIRGISLSTEGRSETEISAKKEDIESRLKAGEELSALAAEYADGPEKDSQGDLGTFKQGELEGTLWSAVENLEVGEISDWIEFRGSWFLLMVEEKKDSRRETYEDVRNRIEEKLYMEQRQTKLEAYLEDLKERSFIRILIPNPLEYKG